MVSLCIEYTGHESVEKWIEAYRDHKGKLHTWSHLTEHGVRDARVGPWLKYPLGTFIYRLLAKRRSLKAKKNLYCQFTISKQYFNYLQI